MQPMYFLPNRALRDLLAGEQLKRDQLDRHGLAQVFADVGTIGVDVLPGELIGPGPGGLTGVILAAYTAGKGSIPMHTYQADIQDSSPTGCHNRCPAEQVVPVSGQRHPSAARCYGSASTGARRRRRTTLSARRRSAAIACRSPVAAALGKPRKERR